MAEVDLVLFDLGGVLISVGGVRALGELAGISDDLEVWRRWLACPWVREFERGRCSVAEFATGVVDEWNLCVDADTFEARFRSWTGALFDGAAELVRSTRANVAVACLSNSNALQWAEYERDGAAELFDRLFLSHQLGLIKPDREIFEFVLRTSGVPARRVLFLDDNLVNVEAAQSSGIVAVKVQGVAEARDALSQFRLL